MCIQFLPEKIFNPAEVTLNEMVRRYVHPSVMLLHFGPARIGAYTVPLRDVHTKELLERVLVGRSVSQLISQSVGRPVSQLNVLGIFALLAGPVGVRYIEFFFFSLNSILASPLIDIDQTLSKKGHNFNFFDTQLTDKIAKFQKELRF